MTGGAGLWGPSEGLGKDFFCTYSTFSSKILSMPSQCQELLESWGQPLRAQGISHTVEPHGSTPPLAGSFSPLKQKNEWAGHHLLVEPQAGIKALLATRGALRNRFSHLHTPHRGFGPRGVRAMYSGKVKCQPDTCAQVKYWHRDGPPSPSQCGPPALCLWQHISSWGPANTPRRLGSGAPGFTHSPCFGSN